MKIRNILSTTFVFSFLVKKCLFGRINFEISSKNLINQRKKEKKKGEQTMEQFSGQK